MTKNEALDKAKHHAKSTRNEAYIYRLEDSVEWQWFTFNPSWMRVKQCRKILPNGVAVKEAICASQQRFAIA